MFNPKTEKIKNINDIDNKGVLSFNNFLFGKTNIYIDYANIKDYFTKNGWHIEIERMKQFFDSFDNIKNIYFYTGLLEGDINSQNENKRIESLQYILRNKIVKIKKISIDYQSLKNESDTSILNNFVRKSLLRKLPVEIIEKMNNIFLDMNNKKELSIEDRKCNFDAEIVHDISKDYLIDKEIETFVLMTSDSDFVDIIEKLLKENKKVMLISTARKVAREFNNIENNNFVIFEINKIKNYLCWNKEINKNIKEKLNKVVQNP